MKAFFVVTGVVIALAAVPASAQKLERINPDGLSTPQTYTHIVKAGTLLFIAGQIGAKADGTIAGPTMAAQLEQVLQNLQLALNSQGATFAHVAKITIFTTSIAEIRAPEAAAIRAKYFGDHKPASTLVQIQQLANPDYKVEIEAIAVLPTTIGVKPVVK
jgi:enamine deaminase RidA (YjgF/YER057c/UK114 family)